ncbi:MAG TPA: transcriptional repressor LexA [Gammaproteobacteria bacterium]|jgi:repressor LexA|nr:transcriptional repressor LexA [Gammaproteobacteria bacterium]
MPSLTARQAEILALIRATLDARGIPPTRAEIAARLGFRSPKAAEDHLRALARKGAIELLPGAARGIRLCESQADAEDAGLPLIGRVAAGAPILAVEHIEGRYQVDPRLFRPRADYLLRVTGESMVEAGIFDGDLLAVHRTPEAADGQIVVARLEDEVTVKRLRRRGRQIELLPANPAFAPILVNRSRAFAIEGLGVGVIRGRA